MQTQAGDPYRLLLDVEVRSSESPVRVERLEMIDRRTTFTLPVTVEPSSVLLDPGTWLLAIVKPLVASQ